MALKQSASSQDLFSVSFTLNDLVIVQELRPVDITVEQVSDTAVILESIDERYLSE